MALKADEVYQAGLALDAKERAAVANRLLDSLPEGQDEPAEFSEEWRKAFRHRIDAIENGEVELVSGAESRARARALLTELGS